MKCPNCGEENQGAFCVRCGTVIPQNQQAQSYGAQDYQQNQGYADQNNQYNGYENQNMYAGNNYNQMNNNPINNIPEEYRPISMWGYFGYQLLFAIPCVGFICLIVFSVGGSKNKNLTNFARSYFCIWIIMIVLALVFLMLTGGLTALVAGASMGY